MRTRKVAMDSIHKLTEYFRDFPGIGPRQAKRFVYFLLTKNPSYLNEISRLISDIKKNIKVCSLCFRFFQDEKTDEKNDVCNICSDKNRNHESLMIVARDVDFESIEKSRVYSGLYFILGGTIPILEKEPEKKVRLEELKDRINKNNLKEVILSLNMTPDGENTADYIKQFIKQYFPNSNIKISLLGRGLSTGSEIEYADVETIKSALENRI